MTEDASSRDVPPVSLSLAPGRRIVTPGLDPVLGWIGAESARPPQPLILPPELLEPCATGKIAYACNLPAVRHPAKKDQAPPVATPAGTEAFTASLPGGQVPVVLPGRTWPRSLLVGQPAALREQRCLAMLLATAHANLNQRLGGSGARLCFRRERFSVEQSGKPGAGIWRFPALPATPGGKADLLSLQVRPRQGHPAPCGWLEEAGVIRPIAPP